MDVATLSINIGDKSGGDNKNGIDTGDNNKNGVGVEWQRWWPVVATGNGEEA